MREGYKEYTICLSCFLFTLLLYLPEVAYGHRKVPSGSSRVPFTSSDHLVKPLQRTTIKKRDLEDTSSIPQDGIVLNVSYSRGRVAVVQVTLTSAYKDPQMKEVSEQSSEGDQRYCCMSKATYIRFLKAINQIGALGVLVRRDPIGVIPTSGWVRRTDYYSRASIVRLERNCSNPDPQLGCGISRLTVFYWIPLEGKVESKRIEKSISIGPELIQYFVMIGDTEVEVSQADYERLREGQVVKLEMAFANLLARILAIKQ